MDYQIQSNSRHCCVTGRELSPGEPVFSVLTRDGMALVRRDYALDAWQGPPEGTVGYWQSKVPVREAARKPVIDDDVLTDCFTRLESQTDPQQLSFRYVVALLLMRRKRLKFEDVEVVDGHEVLRLRCVKTKTLHDVTNPGLSDDEIRTVQDEVFKVLGWN